MVTWSSPLGPELLATLPVTGIRGEHSNKFTVKWMEKWNYDIFLGHLKFEEECSLPELLPVSGLSSVYAGGGTLG